MAVLTWPASAGAVDQPTLVGTPTVGATVSVRPSEVSDRAQLHELRIEACRAPGVDCVTLSAPDPYALADHGTVVIPGWAAGRYIQALDDPVRPGEWLAGPVYLQPEAAPPLTRGGDVLVSPPLVVTSAVRPGLYSAFSPGL
ncbi:hypothetical protein C8N24_3386 [Solirubrobacter pauli]|uniref:Uncharacterized protein n=1 Tax=Solirubrobacter pauli TaxID=166793 RepID=A0A660LEI5_9ACTN|nr:hypothetical protein C8N24_3386 [Solirubrobacter pauli]